MLSLREALRVGGVLTLGGFCGAVALAVLLTIFANVESAQPLFTDISLGRISWSSLLFCFFTLPISWFFGAPVYWLLRRFNLLRVWVCAVLGGIIGVVSAYGILLLSFVPTVQGVAILWFGLSGAAAGSIVGLLLRHPNPPVS